MESCEIKVGILSWFNYPNPGTAFQAYALQQYISSLPCYSAELLNMVNRPQSCFYAPINRYYANKYGVFSRLVKVLLGIKSYMYCSFQRKNIVKWPARPLKPSENYLVSERYDWVILGSDQMWNLNFKGSNTFPKWYYLDFVKGKRKGAYAPSTGNSVWTEEIRSQIRELLSDFSFIGVREKQTVDLVQSLVNVPVHWSLDSTFLLNKKEWAGIARQPKERREYIFEYCIIKSPQLRAVTEKLAEMTGLPIIESHGDLRKHVPSAKKMPHPSADTWLGYLMNAKYVVTDSFHGCAFSINTNRDFYAVTTINETRIYSLLESFDLQDRIIKNDDMIDMPRSIDWDSVKVRLEERRKESQDWLKSSLLG